MQSVSDRIKPPVEIPMDPIVRSPEQMQYYRHNVCIIHLEIPDLNDQKYRRESYAMIKEKDMKQKQSRNHKQKNEQENKYDARLPFQRSRNNVSQLDGDDSLNIKKLRRCLLHCIDSTLKPRNTSVPQLDPSFSSASEEIRRVGSATSAKVTRATLPSTPTSTLLLDEEQKRAKSESNLRGILRREVLRDGGQMRNVLPALGETGGADGSERGCSRGILQRFEGGRDCALDHLRIFESQLGLRQLLPLGDPLMRDDLVDG